MTTLCFARSFLDRHFAGRASFMRRVTVILMPRTRSTVTIDNVAGPFKWYYYFNAPPGTEALNESFHNYGTKTIVDTVTPDYTSLVNSGQFLPINPVTIVTNELTLESYHSGTMDYTGTAYPTVRHYWGELIGEFSPASIDPYVLSSSKQDLVVIKALSEAKTADWDVLVFLGELRETRQLLDNFVLRINNTGRRLANRAWRYERNRARRQKRPYSFRKAVEKFNELWLEARYGWRPLVYEILAICKALRHKTKNKMTRRSAQIIVDLAEVVVGTPFDNGQCRFEGQMERVGKARYRAVCFYKDNMGAVGSNPVIAGWQLKRLSFVVDWFIDITSWLTAISPREGYSGLGISVSATAEYTDTFTQQGMSTHIPPFDTTVSLTPLKKVRKVRSYQRGPYTGVPLPSINVNLNPMKWYDLVALALQGQRDVHTILLRP